MSLEYESLTEKIIGAGIEDHCTLGAGFVESIYHNALCIELRKRSIAFQRELEISVVYDRIEVGGHRIDLFVENTIVVELKATKEFHNCHFAFTRSYLKALKRTHGLLLNFAKPTLDIKRVLNP
jgi:GxxExxY protein